MSDAEGPSDEPAEARLPFTQLGADPSGTWWHWMLDLDPFAPATVPTGPGSAIGAPPAPGPAGMPTAGPRGMSVSRPDRAPAAEPGGTPAAGKPAPVAAPAPRLVFERPPRRAALAKLFVLAVVLGTVAALLVSAGVLVLVILFGHSGS